MSVANQNNQQQQQQQQQPAGNPAGAPYQPQQPQGGAPVAGQTFVQDAAGNFVPVVAPQPVQGQQAPVQPEQTQVQDFSDARQQVEGFLKTAGLSAAQVEQEFGALGTLTESSMKALVDKHGKATTNLLVQEMNRIAEGAKQQAAALETMQHNMVKEAFAGVTEQSGEDTWKELVGWARDNVDQQTRASINAMLKQGGFQAEQAIGFLVTQFKSKNGMEQTGQLVNGDNNQGGGQQGADLTRSEYAKQLDGLVQKHGYNSPEVNALNARREAAAKRGIN
ncbi:head scaffolding protein [Vibrio phage K436]